MVKDVSIEYAHIYTNQRISDEHQIYLEVLDGIKSDLEFKKQTSSLVVLVDDYSFPDPTFDYSSFSDWLEDHDFKPDLLLRESQLIPICDEVLDLVISSKLKQQITDYITSKKYPCSLFIAAWYLLRLGKLNSSIMNNSLQANRLINILPESFKPFEDKGLEIISNTRHNRCVDLIEYRYLPGRLIA